MAFFWTVFLVMGLYGCGDDEAPTPTAEMAEEPYFAGGQYILADSHANVVRTMRIVGETAPGVALGFDLDERVSEAGDVETCRHADLSDPEGRAGIDNQLAVMWPLIEPLVGEPVHGLLQQAINQGRVLIMMELAGVDDLQNDDDVTLNVYRATASPEVGNLGYISPDQTFYYNYQMASSVVENAAIIDGELVAGPVEIDVPLKILDLDYIATVYRGVVRLKIREDGTFDGLIGGAFDVQEWIDTLLMTNAAYEAEIVAPVFTTNADLEPVDGTCSLISLAFEFDGTTAFVVRDTEQETAATK